MIIKNLQHLLDEAVSDVESLEELSDLDYASSSSSGSSTGKKPRRTLHRINNYMQTIEEYDNDEFKEHFRLRRTTCDFVIEKVKQAKILPTHIHGRRKVSVKKAVYMTVWYLSNIETFRQIADRFNVTKSSAYRIISKVTNFLVQCSQRYIVWPSEERIECVKRGFCQMQGINGIVGAIDGTHINIKRPSLRHGHV